MYNPDTQYGFNGGVSTCNQLIDLIYDISSAFNDKKLICVDLVFLYYSSAFDTVNHSILFNELYSFGIRGNALEVLKNLYFNRKQVVKYENSFSQPFIPTSGVAQGAITSPLLFNMGIAL